MERHAKPSPDVPKWSALLSCSSHDPVGSRHIADDFSVQPCRTAVESLMGGPLPLRFVAGGARSAPRLRQPATGTEGIWSDDSR
jgi:hypothetical protein